MGRLHKKPRLSTYDASEISEQDFDLPEARRVNDLRLKNRFESIFEKYSKDFDDVGDEIDLETGTIIVNNGHLETMEDEQDLGLQEATISGLNEAIPGDSRNEGVERDGHSYESRMENSGLEQNSAPIPKYISAANDYTPATDPAWQTPDVPVTLFSDMASRVDKPSLLPRRPLSLSPPNSRSLWAVPQRRFPQTARKKKTPKARHVIQFSKEDFVASDSDDPLGDDSPSKKEPATKPVTAVRFPGYKSSTSVRQNHNHEPLKRTDAAAQEKDLPSNVRFPVNTDMCPANIKTKKGKESTVGDSINRDSNESAVETDTSIHNIETEETPMTAGVTPKDGNGANSQNDVSREPVQRNFPISIQFFSPSDGNQTSSLASSPANLKEASTAETPGDTSVVHSHNAELLPGQSIKEPQTRPSIEPSMGPIDTNPEERPCTELCPEPVESAHPYLLEAKHAPESVEEVPEKHISLSATNIVRSEIPVRSDAIRINASVEPAGPGTPDPHDVEPYQEDAEEQTIPEPDISGDNTDLTAIFHVEGGADSMEMSPMEAHSQNSPKNAENISDEQQPTETNVLIPGEIKTIFEKRIVKHISWEDIAQTTGEKAEEILSSREDYNKLIEEARSKPATHVGLISDILKARPDIIWEDLQSELGGIDLHDLKRHLANMCFVHEVRQNHSTARTDGESLRTPVQSSKSPRRANATASKSRTPMPETPQHLQSRSEARDMSDDDDDPLSHALKTASASKGLSSIELTTPSKIGSSRKKRKSKAMTNTSPLLYRLR